jgi:hypothetical protein
MPSDDHRRRVARHRAHERVGDVHVERRAVELAI